MFVHRWGATSITMPVSRLQSAGLLLFRLRDNHIQVLLGHPGGPFWRRRDQGAWTIPKGLIAPGKTPRLAAFREFVEETGHHPAGELLALGSAKQPGGKVYTCGQFKVTGIQSSFRATHSRWNGRHGPANGKHSPRSTVWPGLALRRRAPRY
jgi:predicted NUDIX family NTP pyrophosphohydrolase